MMAFRHYTREELMHLRDSPLCQKPENLPAIEQWIEYVFVDRDSREKLRIPHSESAQAQPASSRRQPQAKAGGEASPMGNFSTGLRPSLMSARNANRGGGEYCHEFSRVEEEWYHKLTDFEDDVALGPPRTMFPSSRNVSKLSDFPEKTGVDVEDDTPRSRFFGDKANRKSLNEKEARDRESWTSARERRQLGGDDEHKEVRYNRRDRDQDGERRNGHADRHEGGWGRDRRTNGDKQGGWREREREKKERDWDRGGPPEKEPEWMDDPTPATGEDDVLSMGMARNQEEFQRWKAAMSGKKAEDTPPTEPQPAKDAAAVKQPSAFKLEGVVDKPFGGWGDAKPPTTADAAPSATKAAPPKSKGSRFASMFKDQAKEELPPVEPPPPKPEANAADEAGFQRILQMLGGTGISQTGIGQQATESSQTPAQEGPSSPPPRSNANGTKPKSRFTGFFDQTPKSPERVKSPREVNEDMFQSTRGLGDEPSVISAGRAGDKQSIQAPSNPMSPEPPMFPPNGNREQQPSRSHHMNDLFLDQPPSRGAGTPDNNIQNLLAHQRSQRAQGQDKNFLLDLLQAKGSSRPASQQARADNNFPLWLDQPPNMPETHAPQPRVPPPPGLFEDQLLRNAPPEQRQEQPSMPERRTSQRAPPGFYDEQSMFLQQQQQQQQQAAQRRTFTEPQQQQVPGRRMSGHPNLPQMQIPQHHQQFTGPPPEFLQSPGGHQQAPPPGFNPHMPRHPPGFHNINIFQPPQGGPPSAREPPGFPPGGMPASAGGMQSPPNVPPGFFGGPQGVPPGFMQMRSPTEGISAGAGPMRGSGRGFDGGFDGPMGRR